MHQEFRAIPDEESNQAVDTFKVLGAAGSAGLIGIFSPGAHAKRLYHPRQHTANVKRASSGLKLECSVHALCEQH